MKNRFTQRRFRANKARSCPMCKPYKQGHETKRTFNEQRRLIGVADEVREATQTSE